MGYCVFIQYMKPINNLCQEHSKLPAILSMKLGPVAVCLYSRCILRVTGVTIVQCIVQAKPLAISWDTSCNIFYACCAVPGKDCAPLPTISYSAWGSCNSYPPALHCASRNMDARCNSRCGENSNTSSNHLNLGGCHKTSLDLIGDTVFK